MPSGIRLDPKVRKRRNELIDSYLDDGAYGASFIASKLMGITEFAGIKHTSLCVDVSLRKKERGMPLEPRASAGLVNIRKQAIKKIVISGDTNLTSISRKMMDLPCFQGIVFGSIEAFVRRHSKELGVTNICKNGDISESLEADNAKPIMATTDLDAGIVKFDDILSRHTPELSYRESLKFTNFVETHLRPFIDKLQGRADLAVSLQGKISEFESHKCPNASSESLMMIQELRGEIETLTGENSRLKQRNSILSADNTKLLKRVSNVGSAMAVHAESVRLGAERQL